MSRLLDLPPSKLAALRGEDLVAAIRDSEGRCVAAETIVSAGPLLDKVSNPELAAAFGADILVLNMYNVEHPGVAGMPDRDERGHGVPDPAFGTIMGGQGWTAGEVGQWTGRVTAVNLEPVDPVHHSFPPGRRATVANAHKLVDQGAAVAVITGNPGTGVTIEAIAEATLDIVRATGGALVVMAGRMHAAASGQPVMTPRDVERLAEAGAHGVILPAPGTVPGSSVEACAQRVAVAHEAGMLAWNSVGTSQEGASVTVLERLAVDSKISGADIHHIGDSGYFGIAPPENIYAYAVALRGRRHTWHRMAASLRR